MTEAGASTGSRRRALQKCRSTPGPLPLGRAPAVFGGVLGACSVLAIRKPTSPASRGRGGKAAGSIRYVMGGGSDDRLGRSGFRRAAALARDHAGLPRRSRAPQQRAAVSRRPGQEIVSVMRQVAEERHGWRLRGLIVVLWRGGLRVHEALALGEPDLDPHRGSLLVRHGKGGRRREIGMDAWGWSSSRPGSRHALSCQSGRSSASSTAQLAGGPGQARLSAPGSAGSPSRRESRRRFAHTNSATPTRSNSPARASRSTSSNDSSVTRTSAPPRSISKASTTRDHRHVPSARRRRCPHHSYFDSDRRYQCTRAGPPGAPAGRRRPEPILDGKRAPE